MKYLTNMIRSKGIVKFLKENVMQQKWMRLVKTHFLDQRYEELLGNAISEDGKAMCGN